MTPWKRLFLSPFIIAFSLLRELVNDFKLINRENIRKLFSGWGLKDKVL
jgi:hypothetical protein